MNLCLLESVTACVELFGGGEKRCETVVQPRGADQIDAPELDLAGLEWREDIDLFPISHHIDTALVPSIAIIISCQGILVLRLAENMTKYWEIYNFQVSYVSNSLHRFFELCVQLGNMNGLTSSASDSTFRCSCIL
jgi:hypothetical protein